MGDGDGFGIGVLVGWFTAFVTLVSLNWAYSGHDISTGSVRAVHAKIEIMNKTQGGETWQRYIVPLEEANKCKVGDIIQVTDGSVTVLTPNIKSERGAE